MAILETDGCRALSKVTSLSKLSSLALNLLLNRKRLKSVLFSVFFFCYQEFIIGKKRQGRRTRGQYVNSRTYATIASVS